MAKKKTQVGNCDLEAVSEERYENSDFPAGITLSLGPEQIDYKVSAIRRVPIEDGGTVPVDPEIALAEARAEEAAADGN